MQFRFSRRTSVYRRQAGQYQFMECKEPCLQRTYSRMEIFYLLYLRRRRARDDWQLTVLNGSFAASGVLQ